MNAETVFSFSDHFFRTYMTAMPKILYRMGILPLINPKKSQHFIHQILNADDLETDDPVLGSINITDIFPNHSDGIDINIIGSYYNKQSSDARILMELSSLAYLIKSLNPKMIFEMGTFVGRTTRLFAINSGSDCKIFTLDLPQIQVNHKIGEAFFNTKEAEKIIQLFGNSVTFDFSPWYGKCDFVWVDACHDYEYVVSDTDNALKICRPGGFIGFHDYRHTASWSGVTRTVRQIYAKFKNIRHLKGTTIALLKKTEESSL